MKSRPPRRHRAQLRRFRVEGIPGIDECLVSARFIARLPKDTLAAVLEASVRAFTRAAVRTLERRARDIEALGRAASDPPRPIGP